MCYGQGMATPENPFFGISIKEIARVCEVDITTARRWKRGAICPPAGAVARFKGDLGFLDPQWAGWILRGGSLVSPESWVVTMHDVLATPLMRSQIAVYQVENRGLKRDLADALANRLEEQPLAEEWAIPENWVIVA